VRNKTDPAYVQTLAKELRTANPKHKPLKDENILLERIIHNIFFQPANFRKIMNPDNPWHDFHWVHLIRRDRKDQKTIRRAIAEGKTRLRGRKIGGAKNDAYLELCTRKQAWQELQDIIMSREDSVESWFRDLVIKILLGVNRVRVDLLRTMDQETVSGAAWNARNLLELWVWLKYCAASRANARRFYEDAIRDVQGITDSLAKLHSLREIPNEFEAPAREKIADVIREKLGLDSLEGSYERVAEAARSVGAYDWFAANNAFLSKFAHPTAGLILGIMHQVESLRALQATMTTSGVFFAGQCVIALEEITCANFQRPSR
jgi:hypothetical protein